MYDNTTPSLVKVSFGCTSPVASLLMVDGKLCPRIPPVKGLQIYERIFFSKKPSNLDFTLVYEVLSGPTTKLILSYIIIFSCIFLTITRGYPYIFFFNLNVFASGLY